MKYMMLKFTVTDVKFLSDATQVAKATGMHRNTVVNRLMGDDKYTLIGDYIIFKGEFIKSSRGKKNEDTGKDSKLRPAHKGEDTIEDR